MAKKESFYNLVDKCIEMESEKSLAGNTQEMFRRLLTDYFFQIESGESKKIENIFKNMEFPDFLKETPSIMDLDIKKLGSFIQGEMIKDSLSGKVFSSSEYLKSFQPHHAPVFGKLPGEVQREILEDIKIRNAIILEAFEKMKADRAADKSRKVITLVALIIKNVHLRTGCPLNDMGSGAEKLIRDTFLNCDETYNGSQRQQADLIDDKKIKQVIKSFFVVKKFQDISEMADLFRTELERYRKRAVKA